MCPIEKQKTCITIIGTIDPSTGSFSEEIHIPHQVDKIRVTSVGFLCRGSGNLTINAVYCVVSDLIGNQHDNYLGIAPNVNICYPHTGVKEFINYSKKVDGTYLFTVYNLLSMAIDHAINNGKCTIGLEFIELDE